MAAYYRTISPTTTAKDSMMSRTNWKIHNCLAESAIPKTRPTFQVSTEKISRMSRTFPAVRMRRRTKRKPKPRLKS